MNAEQAIASMREDIAALERRNVVKPGHIRRRIAEVDAIADAFAAMDGLIFTSEAQVDDLRRELESKERIIGILGNMLTILGFGWQQRVRDANDHEARIMRRAAAIAAAHNRYNINDEHTPKHQLQHALGNAILAARVEEALAQLPHHIRRHVEEEERTNA